MSEASRRQCFFPNFPVNMLPMYVPPPPIVPGPAFTRSAVSASAVLSRRHHSGGRVDHTPTRKVITVSLQQAVQLHTSENAWKPATLKTTADSAAPEQIATQVRCLHFMFIQYSVIVGFKITPVSHSQIYCSTKLLYDLVVLVNPIVKYPVLIAMCWLQDDIVFYPKIHYSTRFHTTFPLLFEL